MEQTTTRAHDTSVDLKLTAKGLYYWEITVRIDNEGWSNEDHATMVTELLEAIDAKLHLTFPHNTVDQETA